MQAAFVLWLAAAAPAFGATITVNTTDDELGADNRCSLREAISAANNDSAPFAGAGECAAGDASDTVALPAGMFKLSIGGPPDDTNAAGDLDILGTQLAIAGAGASATTIDADHIDRTLDVRPGRIAAIQGVTITGGRVPNGSNGSSVVGGTGGNGIGTAGGDGADGGGIRNAGTLTVLDAVPMSGAGCAITDQRGVARPQGADCDIGAYEHAPPGVATGDANAVSSAAAMLRGQLNPNARVSSYHFELGTTTAYGTSTASQTTGAGVSPEAVAAAVRGLAPRTTYHFRLVATNADGTTAGEDRTFTTQAPSDNKAPRFLAAALARKVFAVDPRGRAEAPVAARAKRGTTFRYRLSEAARVVFTIGRALPGRRVGRACRKRTARNRTRRPCTRYVRVGRFAATASARANRKRFSGRIARRALKPGRYRASLVATDAAGNASPPKRLAFRVVRR